MPDTAKPSVKQEQINRPESPNSPNIQKDEDYFSYNNVLFIVKDEWNNEETEPNSAETLQE